MLLKNKISAAVRSAKSYLCVGLDIHPDRLPASIRGNVESSLIYFNSALIEATAQFTAAYKLNLAFYEALGEIGFRVLKASVDAIPDSRLVIADGKRGDIGSSAERYAEALFERMGADMATVNPYMGFDSVEPFISREDKGAFILALTSNPGAKDFQCGANGEPLYETVAAKAVEWNSRENIGLVVGATQGDRIARIRAIAPDLPFLVPGVGAQGGDLEKVVKGTMKGWNGVSLINSSRGIIYASSGEDFAQAAGTAAKTLRDNINRNIIVL